MTPVSPLSSAMRYDRQIRFGALGEDGQKRLSEARVLLVGVGGLGSWAGELLARSGVGTLRLVDDDHVDWTNLARQAMYTECDATRETPKALAAAQYLRQRNTEVCIEPILERFRAANADDLAAGMDLILDGTDDFTTRFIINDYCVREQLPWVFAGVVRAEGQVLPVLPGRSACLRCLYDAPPPPDKEQAMKATTVGVLGPAVAAIAAIQVVEAIKILTGAHDAVSPYLTKLSLWDHRVQQLRAEAQSDCPCCGKRQFEFLNA